MAPKPPLLGEHPIIHIEASKHQAPADDNPCAHIPPATVTYFPFNEMRDVIMQDFERKYLHRLMLATDGNVTKAARLASKERRCFGKLLKKHGIDREDYLG